MKSYLTIFIEKSNNKQMLLDIINGSIFFRNLDTEFMYIAILGVTNGFTNEVIASRTIESYYRSLRNKFNVHTYQKEYIK